MTELVMDRPTKRQRQSDEDKLWTIENLVREKALCYLPAKSLLRFQSVSTEWNIKIASPQFAHSQSISHRSKSSIFFQEEDDPPRLILSDPQSYGVPDPSLSFLPEEKVTIESSCNGLLCCRAEQDWRVSYYICNPATRQWKKLPETDSYVHLTSVLAFEPSPSNAEPEYQLICPVSLDRAIGFDVYSSREGTWTLVRTPLYYSVDYNWDSGSYTAGTVHWKNGDRMVMYRVANRETLVVRNVQTRGVLGFANGGLCRARIDHNEGFLKVYAFDYDASSWILRENVNLEEAIGGETLLERRSIIAVFDESVIFASEEFSVFLWDMSSREVKDLGWLVRRDADSLKCFAYVNSLVRFENGGGGGN